MSAATLVYPHQLFEHSPALAAAKAGAWPVYLIEEPLILTHNPIHRQKLIFHKLSLDAYQTELEDQGYQVTRLSIIEHATSADVFAHIKREGVTNIHIADTTDNYLEQAIAKSGLTRVWYESPLFILEKADAMERFVGSKRFMASFYKKLRQDKNILIDTAGKPTGGKWSFDEDNRQKLPKNIALPKDIALQKDAAIMEAQSWTDTITAEKYGEPGCWLPYTRAGAEKFLQEFFRARFHNFGPYEDALTTRSVRLWHSTLSPLLNVGLLTPEKVLADTLDYAAEHDVPINSLEGFVRQVLGWREFIRASYECDGGGMRTQNFWQHERSLPDSFWTGTTGIDPVDHVVKTALSYGYTHHIERLMVMGNFMLLAQMHPTEVYRWFMGLYVDAYDWVMVPNVYGMSQFADGGSFATKPYISGSNYIKKMSDYPKGAGENNWEEIWTALYWHFIATHKTFFTSNHRLSMMPRLLEKMDDQKRSLYLEKASEYLQQN